METSFSKYSEWMNVKVDQHDQCPCVKITITLALDVPTELYHKINDDLQTFLEDDDTLSKCVGCQTITYVLKDECVKQDKERRIWFHNQLVPIRKEILRLKAEGIDTSQIRLPTYNTPDSFYNVIVGREPHKYTIKTTTESRIYKTMNNLVYSA